MKNLVESANRYMYGEENTETIKEEKGGAKGILFLDQGELNQEMIDALRKAFGRNWSVVADTPDTNYIAKTLNNFGTDVAVFSSDNLPHGIEVGPEDGEEIGAGLIVVKGVDFGAEEEAEAEVEEVPEEGGIEKDPAKW